MKKVLLSFTVFLTLLYVGNAQISPAPVCIDFEAGADSGACGGVIDPADYGSLVGASHGTPRVLTTQACNGTGSLLMGVNGGDCGEGFFLNYNFQAGYNYTITFNSMLWSGSNSSAVLSNYVLHVHGASGLVHDTSIPANPCSSCAENASSVSVVSQSDIATLNYSVIAASGACYANTLSFTPCEDYRQLWLFPVSTTALNVGILIDDLCVFQGRQCCSNPPLSSTLHEDGGGDIGGPSDKLKKGTDGLSVWPNPTNGRFSVEFLGNGDATADGQQLQVKVYNVAGQLVYSHPLDGSHRLDVDMGPSMGNGLYTVSVQRGDEVLEAKQVMLNRE